MSTARSRVQQVGAKLSELERVKGGDAKAARYLSQYPRHVEDFDRATRHFLELKKYQHAISEVPRRCQDLDRQLQEQAQRFERERDGDDSRSIPGARPRSGAATPRRSATR